MRPLEEWDEDYIDNVIRTADESAWLEKKASAKFVLTTRGQPDDDTKQELAKQVSAFSNAGQGHLVYGIDDINKTIDAGVPEFIGRQPVKAWIEQVVPTLVFPPICQCVAQWIHLPANDPGRGVLVVSIPLSERRPHWVISGPQEIAYIRAGEHSLPMRLQTVLDIASRGTTSQIEIESLGRRGKRTIDDRGHVQYEINPLVRLVAGPVCELWSFEMKILSGSSGLSKPTSRAESDHASYLYIIGERPLFPGRSTPVAPNPFSLDFAPGGGDLRILTIAYADSAQPVRREFTLADLEA
jgi:hypothetical protein